MSFRLTPRARLWARIVTAVFGGYALSSLAVVVLSFLLPLPAEEAVLAATLCGFALYTACIVWVFAEPRLERLWRRMAGAAAVLGGIALGFLWLGGQP